MDREGESGRRGFNYTFGLTLALNAVLKIRLEMRLKGSITPQSRVPAELRQVTNQPRIRSRLTNERALIIGDLSESERWAEMILDGEAQEDLFDIRIPFFNSREEMRHHRHGAVESNFKGTLNATDMPR